MEMIDQCFQVVLSICIFRIMYMKVQESTGSMFYATNLNNNMKIKKTNVATFRFNSSIVLQNVINWSFLSLSRHEMKIKEK